MDALVPVTTGPMRAPSIMVHCASAESLERLDAGEVWDVLVIGGGATGLGTAVDAASRGYRTLLLEAHDFAQGTSSRSTKLIHGGVRYLAQGNLPLVREALHERGLLLRNAPHLVHARSSWSRPTITGSCPTTRRGSGSTTAWRASWASAARDGSRGRRDRPRADDPLVRAAGWDRLHRRPVRRRPAGHRPGPHPRRPGGLCPQPHAGHRPGQAGRQGSAACEAATQETGEEFTIAAKVVVNATGVFADAIRRLDDPGLPADDRPSQGAHIVLDRSFLPGETAIMIPKTDDGRVLFAIPWSGRVLVGTTDTRPWRPRPSRGRSRGRSTSCSTTPDATWRRLPTRSDIKSLFAGLRPLIRPAEPATARPRSCLANTPSSSRIPDSSRSPAASGRPIAAWAWTPSTTPPGSAGSRRVDPRPSR